MAIADILQEVGEFSLVPRGEALTCQGSCLSRKSVSGDPTLATLSLEWAPRRSIIVEDAGRLIPLHILRVVRCEMETRVQSRLTSCSISKHALSNAQSGTDGTVWRGASSFEVPVQH
ncbi:hypothetical protein XPA_000821 [Xanthoria parietina]